MNQQDVNKARSLHYALFSSLFAYLGGARRDEQYVQISPLLDLLGKHAADPLSEDTFRNMSEILKQKGAETVAQEFDTIFYDLSDEPVPTTASFYLEEREDGRPRRQMVEYLLQSRYRRDEGRYSDLEDDIGFILSFLRHLVQDEAEGDEFSGLLAREVFKEVLNPFVDEFIESLYHHEAADFYREAAVALKLFVNLERSWLGIPKPEEVERIRRKETPPNISEAEAKRRLENKRKKGTQKEVSCQLEEGGDVEEDL